MNESRPVAEGKSKTGIPNGKIRQHLYNNAFNHIFKSIQNGYFLEAIALEESFISDRLASYCSYKKYMRKCYATLGEITKNYLTKDENFSKNILTEVDTWRTMRNTCLHAMVKFAEGEDADWGEKVIFAKEVAEKGEKLCRNVDKEISRLRRLSKKENEN